MSMKLTRKSIGRIAATFVATAMLATMAIVPASADEGDPTETTPSTQTSVTSVAVTKVVKTDGDTYAPNTSFKINVEPGTTESGTVTIEGTEYTYAPGPANGLSGTEIAFAPDTDTATNETYTQTGSLTVNPSAFNSYAPGVYQYVITEEDSGYEGIDYDDNTYYAYVYWMNKDNLTEKYVAAVIIVDSTGAKVRNLTFTNDYGYNEETNNSTHDVIITKNVEGAFADMSDTFSFDVSVTGGIGEAYKVVTTIDGQATTSYIMANDPATTIPGIGDGDTIHIYGLSANDSYTVTETNGESQGYTVTDSDGETNGYGTVSGKLTADNTQASITNTKSGSTPTGIMMDIAPYALLVVVAAAGCFIFLRKRNSSKD